MKRILAIIILSLSAFSLDAQDYPLEWRQYTSDGYFHDIESGINEKKLPEERFRNDLLDMARTNLAKKIEVKVEEVNQMSKDVVNGNANIYYSSQRNLSTNLDMRFTQSESHIDMVTGQQYVIVYINKAEACQYYAKEMNVLLSRIDNQITLANNYIGTGFKSKAKEELQTAITMFDDADEIFFWLNLYGMPDYQIQQYLEQIHDKEQTVKSQLADLEYGTTYCIICTADNFGKPYPKLKNEIKGDLSASGCNFVDDPDMADYVIYIDASSREYNTSVFGNVTSYYSFVDATIAVDKVSTNQRILEDEISEKGSHTKSYNEAGRDGYKKVMKAISKILKENIKL